MTRPTIGDAMEPVALVIDAVRWNVSTAAVLSNRAVVPMIEVNGADP